jgi:nucleoside-diphosphate-sugar epimerase
MECQLGRAEDLRRALCDVDTVFHCAALCGPPGSLEDYQEANVAGTIRLARLAAEAGVKTLVYMSSMSVYAPPRRSKPHLDESAPNDERAAERGVYTQSKLAAERSLLEFARQHSSPRVVVLRPGTIYGPGAKLPLGRLQLPSSSDRPILAGSRRISAGLVYVDNVIDAMLAAAGSDVPSGSVYNLVDSTECDQGEVARTLRELTQGRIRPLFVPYGVVWALMLGVDLVSLTRHGQLGTARYRLKRTLADMRFDCTAARRDLGLEPRVPLTEGLRRALDGVMPAPGNS